MTTMNNNDNPSTSSTIGNLLRLAFMLGQPDNGKSFLASLLVDLGKLGRHPDVYLGDGEEGTNLVFTRSSPSTIKPIKIEDEHDMEEVVLRMEDDGKHFGLLDMPGSSQRPIRRACGDFSRLTGSEVEVIPIIVVGSRAGSEQVGVDWLKIVSSLPRVYWIWNNQNYDKADNRQLPADLEKQIPGITAKIREIRIPALRSDISQAITVTGASASSVAEGRSKETILRHRMVKFAVAAWRKQAEEALAPLLEEFPALVAPESPSAEPSPQAQQ